MKAATVINLKNEKRVEYIKKLFIFIILKKNTYIYKQNESKWK